MKRIPFLKAQPFGMRRHLREAGRMACLALVLLLTTAPLTACRQSKSPTAGTAPSQLARSSELATGTANQADSADGTASAASLPATPAAVTGGQTSAGSPQDSALPGAAAQTEASGDTAAKSPKKSATQGSSSSAPKKSSGTAGTGSAPAQSPAQSGSGSSGKQTLSVSITIDCKTAYAEDPDAVAALSKSGIIVPTKRLELSAGASVKTALEASGVDVGITAEGYVYSIGGLSERDVGAKSGWVYSVNGVWPQVGCKSYKLKAGDRIAWRYTLNLGKDVGAPVAGS